MSTIAEQMADDMRLFRRYERMSARDLMAHAEALEAALRELLSGHDNLYRAHFPGMDPRDDIAAKAARAVLGRNA